MRPDQDAPTHGPWKPISPLSRRPCKKHPAVLSNGIRSVIEKDGSGVLVVNFEEGCYVCSGLTEVVE